MPFVSVAQLGLSDLLRSGIHLVLGDVRGRWIALFGRYLDWTRVYLRPASMNCRHLFSILAWSSKSIRCLDLTGATAKLMDPRLSMTASENQLMNSGEFTTFCTMWSTNVFNAADTRLPTPFLLGLSVSSTNLFSPSSTCIGIPPTASRTRSSSIV